MKAPIVPFMLALLVWSTAEAGPPRWTLRFHGAVVESSGSHDAVAANGSTIRIDRGTSGGFGIGAEYRLSDRVGLEVSTLFAALEIDTHVSAKGSALGERLELSMMPWMLSIPIHFDTAGKADLFIAPTVGHVTYYNARTSWNPSFAAAGVEIGSDTAYGAAIGLDAGIGSGPNWAFSAGLRYLRASAGDTNVDPLIVTVGFAYRFGPSKERSLR